VRRFGKSLKEFNKIHDSRSKASFTRAPCDRSRRWSFVVKVVNSHGTENDAGYLKHLKYKVSLLSCPWARQLSQNVPADAALL
jgi:hypothetical protein